MTTRLKTALESRRQRQQSESWLDWKTQQQTSVDDQQQVVSDYSEESDHQQHQETREFLRLSQCYCNDCVQRRVEHKSWLDTAATQSAFVRSQLKDNVEPDNWHNGLFPPEDIGTPFYNYNGDLYHTKWPDPFYFRQEGGYLTPVIWWDTTSDGNHHVEFNHDSRAPSEQQCRIVALRLRELNGKEVNNSEAYQR